MHLSIVSWRRILIGTVLVCPSLLGQVQPVRPTARTITLGFGAVVPWSNKPHNGVDYASALGTQLLSVGPGGVIAPAGYTKTDASRFGSIDPDGRGPAIWMKFTLVTGEPIYVLYGHTADSWEDKSTGIGTAAFTFDASYTIHWKTGDQIDASSLVGMTAPYYKEGKPSPHLHVSVFKPRKTCNNNTTYCPPPLTGWGYSDPSVPGGDYIDPELFFTQSQYLLQDASPVLLGTDMPTTTDISVELAVAYYQFVAQEIFVSTPIEVNEIAVDMAGFGTDPFTIWLTNALGPTATTSNVLFQKQLIFPRTGGGTIGSQTVKVAAQVSLPAGTYYLLLTAAQLSPLQGWLQASLDLPSSRGRFGSVLVTDFFLGGFSNVLFPPASIFVRPPEIATTDPALAFQFLR